jgi:hypothetical protein
MGQQAKSIRPRFSRPLTDHGTRVGFGRNPVAGMMFDISILFLSLLKNLLFTPGCAPLNDGSRDFRNLLDQ